MVQQSGIFNMKTIKFKEGDRVKFTDKPFLSNGYVLKVHGSPYDRSVAIYTIKLDEYAPNEYAWNTDEVLSFGDDIELEE